VGAFVGGFAVIVCVYYTALALGVTEATVIRCGGKLYLRYSTPDSLRYSTPYGLRYPTPDLSYSASRVMNK